MKLYLEDDNGQKIEVTPLRDLGSETDVIILMTKACWPKERIKEEEDYYSHKFGKRVVIVEGMYSDIYGIKDNEPTLEEMALRHE